MPRTLTLTFGTLPARDSATWAALCAAHVPFPMRLSRGDFSAAVDAINQGIDSHLEGVFCECRGPDSAGRPGIIITDSASLHTFVRRLTERFDSDCAEHDSEIDGCPDDCPRSIAGSLASSIAEILGIEWV